MAQYHVTHSCGHNVTYQLYGPEKDRQWEIKKMQGRICELCWQAAELAKAQTIANDLGLPKLTGSEAQIAWAEQIRAEIYTQFSALEETPTEVGEFMDWLFRHTESKWWIETRNYPPLAINIGDVFSYLLRGPQTSWRAFHAAWTNRLKAEAKDEIKRAAIAEELRILDQLGAKKTIAVWTSSRDPDDHRIYLDGDLVFGTKSKTETDASWPPEDVALMTQLCQKYKEKKFTRRQRS
jgi:hypothetical protein